MDTASGQSLAVKAEVLYLANLMLAPGLAFSMLLLLYWFNRNTADALAMNHLSQTVGVSVTGGALLVLTTGVRRTVPVVTLRASTPVRFA